ncbi:ParA family protein [Burkholderia gladioli]|uniref:ParA family protein n=1 Tax=Burkholderia gladioli TaxID=28095 RepID=UPI00163F9596|nr:ParA family protein [Burkholderia gladioli]MBU9155200.1 ParA family protein [Burkholderia gladioli]MCH7274099.1 ParA family protein [Burkholderia gladioli]
MLKPAKPKKAAVVAVLNMKGGVGKTTISAHVFRHLYLHLARSTVLVDFDPQFNLTQTIISQSYYERLKAAKKTILSVMEDHSAPSIFKISDKLGPPPDLDSVSIPVKKLMERPEVNLRIIPGDFDLVKYSLINDANVLDPVRQRFSSFIENARDQKDVICIDCNPSSSFMTLCALQVATHVIVPVRPDRYSLLGLKLLDQFISEIPTIVKKPKLIVMLNGIKAKGYDPAVENSLRSDPYFGPMTMVAGLHTSKLLEATTAYTGFATDRKQNWRVTPQITSIVEELGKSLGIV